jgi:hypothetical protein
MMDKQQNTPEKTEGRIETADLIDPFLRRDSISRTPPAMSKESRTENTPIIVNDDTPEGKNTKNIQSDDNADSDNDIRKKTGKQQRLTEFYSLNPTSGGKAEKKEDLSEDDDEEWELKTPSRHSKKRKKKNSPTVSQPTAEISAAMLSLQTKIDKLADFCKANQNVHKELKNLAKEIRSINRTVVKEAKEKKLDWREKESKYLQTKHDLKRELANLRRDETDEERKTRRKPKTKEAEVQTEDMDGPMECRVKTTEVSTQTGQTTREQVWKASTYEEYASIVAEKWEDPCYTVTEIIEGNPLQAARDTDLTVWVKKGDDMEKGLPRMFKERYPELAELEGNRVASIEISVRYGDKEKCTSERVITRMEERDYFNDLHQLRLAMVRKGRKKRWPSLNRT